jgi:preprotein translocase subunit SecE
VRFIGRIIGFTYIRGSWQELKQVTWPSRSEGRRLTTAVIIFSIVFGVLIALVDFGLDKLFKDLLLK